MDRGTLTRQAAGAGVGLTANVLRSQRGDAVVLCDVSLSVEPSEMAAIVVGSGAGKTALLEVLSCAT